MAFWRPSSAARVADGAPGGVADVDPHRQVLDRPGDGHRQRDAAALLGVTIEVGSGFTRQCLRQLGAAAELGRHVGQPQRARRRQVDVGGRHREVVGAHRAVGDAQRRAETGEALAARCVARGATAGPALGRMPPAPTSRSRWCAPAGGRRWCRWRCRRGPARCAVRSACSIWRPSPSSLIVPASLPVIAPGEPANAISSAASTPITLARHWKRGSRRAPAPSALVAAAEDAEVNGSNPTSRGS